MLFDREFIDKVRENPIEGIIEIWDKTCEKIGSESGNWNESKQELLMEAASLIRMIVVNNDIAFEFPLPELKRDIGQNCVDFYNYIHQAVEHCKFQKKFLSLHKYMEFHEKIFNDDGFCYEFDEADLKRVQELINELRGLILDNEVISYDHKRRLLKRLEALQSELHKKVSDLDRFWGMVGDAGVAVGKLGKDAKPIVERIKELTGIVWRTQVRAEGLPNSHHPMLGQYEEK